MNDLKIAVSVSELREIKVLCERFLNPKVYWNDDTEIMKKERDNIKTKAVVTIDSLVSKMLE